MGGGVIDLEKCSRECREAVLERPRISIGLSCNNKRNQMKVMIFDDRNFRRELMVGGLPECGG